MAEKQIKKMNAKEFQENGYLQELNRQFLHPLGLALEVIIDTEINNAVFGEVWDYRDDPEGIVFDEVFTPEMLHKAAKVLKEQKRISAVSYTHLTLPTILLV